MFFSFNYHSLKTLKTHAVNEGLHELMHKDVSCDGSWAAIFALPEGSYVSLNYLHVTGTPVVAFAARREDVASLTTLDSPLECVTRTLEGVMNPSMYVSPPTQQNPRFRSLGASSGNIHIPSVQAFEVMVVKNKYDDGKSIIINMGEIFTLEEQRAHIVGPLILAIKQALDKQSVPHSRVFGETDEDCLMSNEMLFATMVLEAMTVGMDLVIGVMPTGKLDGGFSFAWKSAKLPKKMPLLGLLHNMHDEQSCIHPDDYAFITNIPDLRCRLGSDLILSPPNRKEYVEIKKNGTHTIISSDPHFRSLVSRPSYDPYAHRDAQEQFQVQLIDDLDVRISKSLGVSGLNLSHSFFGMTNFKGLSIPPQTVCVGLYEDVNTVDAIRKRMRV